MDGFLKTFSALSYREVFSRREFHVFEQALPEPDFDMYVKSERYF